ncbi:hypothetical protein EAE96_003875 [Botrytis aclada]|nr:hypothetical protein EAE96_003875 [Botrytis aclada]
MDSFSSDDDRGPTAIAIVWVEYAIIMVLIVSRFYARHLIRSVGLDDWTMLLTAIVFLSLAIVITHSASLGGFRHLIHINPLNLSQIALETFVAQALTIFAYGLGKFSIGCTILRILPHTSKWRKWFIWGLICTTLVYNWLECVLTFFQCLPSRSLWDPTVLPTSCWSFYAKMANIYVGRGFNIVTDIVLALFPISFIWTLKMNKWDRVKLCILLGLGLLAAICSAVKLSYVHTLNDLADLTWGTYDLDMWSASELFVIIVCGSIPTLKILWDRWSGKPSLKSTRGSGYQLGSTKNSGNRSAKRQDSYIMISKGDVGLVDNAGIGGIKQETGITVTKGVRIDIDNGDSV